MILDEIYDHVDKKKGGMVHRAGDELLCETSRVEKELQNLTQRIRAGCSAADIDVRLINKDDCPDLTDDFVKTTHSKVSMNVPGKINRPSCVYILTDLPSPTQ